MYVWFIDLVCFIFTIIVSIIVSNSIFLFYFFSKVALYLLVLLPLASALQFLASFLPFHTKRQSWTIILLSFVISLLAIPFIV